MQVDLNLRTTEIEDQYIQTNFIRLSDFVRSQATLNAEFTFFSLTFTAAVTNKKIMHRLGYAPKDVLFLSATNGVIPVWNYDNFDKEFIYVTVSGPTVVRAFIGRYREPLV